jgi:hypothetical protein
MFRGRDGPREGRFWSEMMISDEELDKHKLLLRVHACVAVMDPGQSAGGG